MNTVFRCLYCGKPVEAAPESPDEIPCPHCGRKVVVPGRRELPEENILEILRSASVANASRGQPAKASVPAPRGASAPAASPVPFVGEPVPGAKRTDALAPFRCLYCGKQVEPPSGAPPAMNCPHCHRLLTVPGSTELTDQQIRDLFLREKLMDERARTQPGGGAEKQIAYCLILFGMVGLFVCLVLLYLNSPEQVKSWRETMGLNVVALRGWMLLALSFLNVGVMIAGLVALIRHSTRIY